MISVLKYPSEDAEAFLKKLEQRAFMGIAKDVEKTVEEIIKRVYDEGDEAILDYTRRFDWKDATADRLIVSENEIEEGWRKVDSALLDIIKTA
jgi:histidinol dehydrogenase